MPIDLNGLRERFFFLFPGKTQKSIAESLYGGDEAIKKQVQISKWKKGREPIPMDALVRLVSKTMVSWDWLLGGITSDLKCLLRIYGLHKNHNFYEDVGNEWVAYAVLSGTDEDRRDCLEVANRLYFLAEAIPSPSHPDILNGILKHMPLLYGDGNKWFMKILLSDKATLNLNEHDYNKNSQVAQNVFKNVSSSFNIDGYSEIPSIRDGNVNFDKLEFVPTKNDPDASIEKMLFMASQFANQGAPPSPGGPVEPPAHVLEPPPATESRPADADSLPPGAIRMVARRPWQSPEARAAADTSARTQTEELDGMAAPITPPADTVLIQVHGESMEPALLDKQYAVIDYEDEGWKGDGGIYVVEVVDSPDATPELFVKHVFLRGEKYVLQSVNPDGDNYTFPVKHVRRIWPVIGAWFMGKGSPAVFKMPRPPRPQRVPEEPSSVQSASIVGVVGSPPLLEIYRSILSLQKTIADIGHQITLHPNAAKREWLAVQAAVEAAFDLHHRLLEPDSDPHSTHPASGESQSA